LDEKKEREKLSQIEKKCSFIQKIMTNTIIQRNQRENSLKLYIFAKNGSVDGSLPVDPKFQIWTYLHRDF